MTEEEKKGEAIQTGTIQPDATIEEVKDLDGKIKWVMITDQKPKETRERVKSLQITLEDRRQHHE